MIAPPDHHLLVHGAGSITLSDAAPVHFVCPSADLLFESLAAAFGSRALAAVLTGMGCDGSGGLRAMKDAGGTIIAQDRVSSEFFGMSNAAIHSGHVDHILTLDAIAPTLVSLVRKGAAP